MSHDPATDDRARRLWGAIAACQAGHERALAAMWARHGLTPAQARMATLLADGPRGLGELARTLGVANGNVTHVLANLAKAGLAERERGVDDRRVARAVLTPAGLARAREARAEAPPLDAALLGALNADEQEILTRLLAKLATGLVGYDLPYG
ncbi:MAG: Transcriptional regulator, MarR family [Cyanobacteria bacterium RYN_339]|nr:Transcriptional regulator, MarR family [Cyanobacteria bacterium RYN_339]